MLNQINKLNIGANILELYQRMAYTEPMAIAELVDNSIHAFYLNESSLSEEARIFITIQNKSEQNVKPYVSISDNCGGMTESDITRLLHLGLPKPDEEKGKFQLSKYGIGFKSSTFWIGKKVIIQTCHHSPGSKGYKIEIDLNKINSTDGYVSITEIQGIAKGSTKVTIEGLNRPFGNRTIKKVRESLEAIYEFYIQQGVKINLDGTYLGPMEEMTFLNDAADNPRMKKYTTTYKGKDFPVVIGALHPAKQSITGVRYYHNNRLLKGYPVSSNYRPAALASWSGDLVQRLICTIDVTALTPTHTKDDVVESTEFIDGLLKQIKSENSEIISAARKGKRSENREQSEKDDATEAKNVLNDIDEKGVINPGSLNILNDLDPDFQSLPKKFREFVLNNSPIHTGIFSFENINFNYQVFLTKSDLQTLARPHVFCDKIDADVVNIQINLNPPFRHYFPDFKNFIVTCAIEGLTEIYLTKSNASIFDENYPTTFRIYFNEFLNNFSELSSEIFTENHEDEDDDEYDD